MIFTVLVSSFGVHPSHFSFHIIGGKDAFILDIVYALKEFGVKLLFGKFIQSKGTFCRELHFKRDTALDNNLSQKHANRFFEFRSNCGIVKTEDIIISYALRNEQTVAEKQTEKY